MKIELILVLDKSGSMQNIKQQAVEGYNAFWEMQASKLIEQGVDIRDVNYTECWFDEACMFSAVSKPFTKRDMGLLTTWPEGGMTALNDAIGSTISKVGPIFAETKPDKVIMAILTDGFENASREFRAPQIKEMIEHHRGKYGWDVIFLAADQDAWATGRQYGVAQSMCIDYKSNETRGAFETMGQTVADFYSK